MPDFNKSAKTAKRLIDKNGRLVTFIRNSRTPDDSNKPWGESDGASQTFDMICAFIDYKVREIDGESIRVGDKKLLANAIDNGDNKIEDFEFVQDGDTKWRIKFVNPTQPGDIVVMYEIQLRR